MSRIIRQLCSTRNLSLYCNHINKSSSIWNFQCSKSFMTGRRNLGDVRVQHHAPEFRGLAVINQEFKEIRLSDYKGKYVVLFFYPYDFTFVCPTEIIAFNDKINEFRALNAEVIGVSADSHYTHLAWKNTARKNGGIGKIEFPLLSDFDKVISGDYNVLIPAQGIPLRGLFIIDPQGIIRNITINDLPVGRSVDEVLRLIKAFQFVEEHGEVCPANWNPESPTIQPDPEKSKRYFESANKFEQ